MSSMLLLWISAISVVMGVISRKISDRQVRQAHKRFVEEYRNAHYPE